MATKIITSTAEDCSDRAGQTTPPNADDGNRSLAQTTSPEFMKTLLFSALLALALVGWRNPARAQSPPIPPPTQLGNISTRASVQIDDNVLIGGFIIQGTEAKKIMVRAIGPSLTAHGITNTLGNPTLVLHNAAGAVIGTNDNWQTTQIGGLITSSQVSDIQNSKLAPSQPNESAIIVTLQPGNYTAVVQGANGTTGIGLMEVYDLSPSATSILGNISTRALVQTGDQVIIGGFIIQGIEAKKVMVRALGPSLTAFGISNALGNPTLSLRDAAGTLIGSNDNWQTTKVGGAVTESQVYEIQNSKLAPSKVSESVIIASLQPGNYTAIVQGVNGATGVGLVEVYDLGSDEGVSPAKITLAEVSESRFNATASIMRFKITGESFSTDADTVQVYHNSNAVPASLTHLDGTEVSVDPILNEGRNDIILVAADSHGRLVYREFTFWAGDNILEGTLVDENGQPANGAELAVRLGDDQGVFSTTVSANGTFSFSNLPDRTVLLNAVASNNRLAALATNGGAGSVHLKLDVIKAPSSIDNNDFDQGTGGWEIGTAPVQIVPHDEGSTGASTFSSTQNQRLRQLTAASAGSMDLLLSTQGEGPQMISRTFKTKAGTKNVTLRYRFITSEVPGGYYGTKYNDSFNVSIRSGLGGRVVTESQSMNGLGLAAFDGSGATAWRETSLPVSAQGDTVQVNLTVSNVADGAYDSNLVVDFVEEKQISITAFNLNDIDGAPLQFLSADSVNPYFGGKTRVHGTVTVEGPSDDELQSLVLEIIQGGVVVATADLAQSARGILLKPFGPGGKVQITSVSLVFELTTAQAANVDGTNDGTLSLRFRATSKNGQEVTEDAGSVQLLVRYRKNNRYPPRDEAQGGDDWARPSLRDLAGHYSGLSWGDFSNMNGGYFSPHGSHTNGIDVDGYFAGYEKRDAAVAAKIIEQLNDPTYGPQITMVFVAFEKKGSNTDFWDAIKDKILTGNRKARDYIRPEKHHTGHFHWRIKGN
jgi:hypothetical protein